MIFTMKEDQCVITVYIMNSHVCEEEPLGPLIFCFSLTHTQKNNLDVTDQTQDMTALDDGNLHMDNNIPIIPHDQTPDNILVACWMKEKTNRSEISSFTDW